MLITQLLPVCKLAQMIQSITVIFLQGPGFVYLFAPTAQLLAFSLTIQQDCAFLYVLSHTFIILLTRLDSVLIFALEDSLQTIRLRPA